MSRQWKWTLAAVIACLLIFAPVRAEEPSAAPDAFVSPLQAQHNLLAVEVAQDTAGQPVVRLEADAPVEYDSFVLDSPDRLVVDLAGTVSRLEDYRYPVQQGGVEQVRAGQHELDPHPVTRVVFDLDGPVPYRIEREAGALVVAFGDAGAAPAVTQVAAEPAPALVAAADPGTAPEPVAAEPVRVAEPAEVAAAPTVEPEIVEPEVAEPEPVEIAEAEPAPAAAQPSRAVEPAAIERLLTPPDLAAPAQGESASTASPTMGSFETRRIVTDAAVYTGKRVSLNLVDADLKQVFRLFHEISGLNFVLDPSVSGRVTIVLDQVPWDQALDLILKNNGLDKVYEGNVLRIASTQKLAQEAASRKQLKEAEELEVEPITVTRTLSYAKASEVQRVIKEGGIMTNRGKVIVDERTNTLIISDVPKKVAPIDALIDTLDAETPQVMIEARIVETSRSYSHELGVSWGFSAIADASRGTATKLSFPHNTSASYGLNLPGQEASTLAFSFGNVIDSFTLDLALNALEIEGQGRILSSPKIATENNRRAEIEQGVRIPIVNTTATEINVEFVSASLRLAVTPQITAEGTISLDITVENNSPDFVNTAGDIPSIRTQRAETKVLVNDGGTTVIGGIFTVNEGVSEQGLPWFRKIPVFGWLFRKREITNENRELLIFITPKIVKLS